MPSERVTRTSVVFRSSFGGDACPCISHETIDRVKTLCGRLCDTAIEVVDDYNNIDPDCRICYRAVKRAKETK